MCAVAGPLWRHRRGRGGRWTRWRGFLLFHHISLLTAQVSPEQRAPSRKLFQRARGGHGDGLGRSEGTWALVAIAGRGREELFFCSSFSPFPLRQLGSRRSSALGAGSGSRVMGGDFMMYCAALLASASFGRSLDEVERTSSFLPLFPADSLGVAAATR